MLERSEKEIRSNKNVRRFQKADESRNSVDVHLNASLPKDKEE